MKQTVKFIAFLFVINTNLCFSQSFINGDLNGLTIGISYLPTNWQRVPYTDVNCIALQVGNDTPDLWDSTLGNSFSGGIFVAGLFGSNPPNFFQEGIMQTVNGFEIGHNYRIHLRQANVKTQFGVDKSGSWALYIDTILIGITNPSYSDEAYIPHNNNLRWDLRTISFTATSTSHLIKFLPIDNDSNWVFSQTDTTGALYMGIDSIGLDILTGVNELSSNSSFKTFPNPSNGSFVITNTGNLNKPTNLKITNAFGQMVDEIAIVNTTTNYENTSLSNGLYFYTIRSKDEELQRGKFLVVK